MADLNKPYKITEKVNGILEKKLNTVEPKFVEQVTEWITKFQTSSGNIVRTKSNRDRMASFKTAIERYLQRAGYYDMISQYLTGFDAMAEAQKEIQKDLNAIDLTKSFLNTYKRIAIKQVVDNMTKQGLMTALINPIRNELNIAVNQGSSLSDVVTSIRGQLSTTEKRQGILKKLSLQSTRDALGQYDGTVNEAVRKTYKLDALLYVGSLVKDSRPQCERWVNYDANGKRGLILFEQLEDEILWADANGTGMIPNTTPENFCQNRGGYNCRHVAYPVRNPNKITQAGNVAKNVDPEITKKEQQEAIEQLKVDSFVPAKNIKQAEEYANQFFVEPVNYRDMDLELANIFNKKLLEYSQNKNFRKLLKVDKLKTKSENALMALGSEFSGNKETGYQNVYFFNFNQFKDSKKLKEQINLGNNQIKETREKFNSGKIPENQLKSVKKLLKSERWIVINTFEEAIDHEFGHIFDNDILKKNKKYREIFKETFKENAYKISAYASTSVEEYIAESFTLYKTNRLNELPEEIIKIFKELL